MNKLMIILFLTTAILLVTVSDVSAGGGVKHGKVEYKYSFGTKGEEHYHTKKGKGHTKAHGYAHVKGEAKHEHVEPVVVTIKKKHHDDD